MTEELLTHDRYDLVVSNFPDARATEEINQSHENRRRLMTEDEKKCTDLIVLNFDEWMREYLGIEIPIPSNASSADVHHEADSSTPGLTHFSHIELSYDPEIEGLDRFVYLFTHELFHFVGKRTYARSLNGKISKNPIYAGFFRGIPVMSPDDDDISIKDPNGHMLNEATTDLAVLHQLDFLQKKHPDKNYLNGIDPAFLYDMIFWDPVYQDMARKANMPYPEFLKSVFADALLAKSPDSRFDAYCDREVTAQFMSRIPYSLGVGIGFLDSLRHIEDGDTEEAIIDYIRENRNLLNVLGLEEQFRSRIESMLQTGKVQLMDAVTVTFDEKIMDGLPEISNAFQRVLADQTQSIEDIDEDDSWMNE